MGTSCQILMPIFGHNLCPNMGIRRSGHDTRASNGSGAMSGPEIKINQEFKMTNQVLIERKIAQFISFITFLN